VIVLNMLQMSLLFAFPLYAAIGEHISDVQTSGVRTSCGL